MSIVVFVGSVVAGIFLSAVLLWEDGFVAQARAGWEVSDSRPARALAGMLSRKPFGCWVCMPAWCIGLSMALIDPMVLIRDVPVLSFLAWTACATGLYFLIGTVVVRTGDDPVGRFLFPFPEELGGTSA